MGGSSSTQIQKNTTRNIVDMISNVTQNVSTNISSDQLVNINCTEYLKAVTDSVKACYKTGGDKAMCNDIYKIYTCQGDNINMKDVINMTEVVKNANDITNKVESELKSKLKNKLEQEAGGASLLTMSFSVGNKAKQSTDNLIETTKKLISTIIQRANTSINSKQEIKIEGGTLKNVNIEAFKNVVKDTLNENKEYKEVNEKLAADLQADLKQTQNMWIAIIGAVVLIVIIIVVFLIMRRRSGGGGGGGSSNIKLSYSEKMAGKYGRPNDRYCQWFGEKKGITQCEAARGCVAASTTSGAVCMTAETADEFKKAEVAAGDAKAKAANAQMMKEEAVKDAQARTGWRQKLSKVNKMIQGKTLKQVPCIELNENACKNNVRCKYDSEEDKCKTLEEELEARYKRLLNQSFTRRASSINESRKHTIQKAFSWVLLIILVIALFKR